MAALLASASVATAEVRRPLGVYAKVDVATLAKSYTGDPARLHDHLQSVYHDLLSNPAISGLTIGVRWDKISLSKPNPSPYGPRMLFGGEDWSWLDDVFAVADRAGSTVQLVLTPGFDTPPWILDKIPSCDPLLVDQLACGEMIFEAFPQWYRSDGTVLPLPWDPTYRSEWQQFLREVNARYGWKPAFVAIAVAGPTGASAEMIYPNSDNTPAKKQPSGLPVDKIWTDLMSWAFPGYSSMPSPDQPIINSWNQVMTTVYEDIFQNVTLILIPDAGNDFPFQDTPLPNPLQPLHADNALYEMGDCSSNPSVSCEAKAEILSNFRDAPGPNGKATQVGGMRAASATAVGDLGVGGVKLFASLPRMMGGASFDHPVSPNTQGGRRTLQIEGCPTYSRPNHLQTCDSLTTEAAAYNVLRVFFDDTPYYQDFSEILDGTTLPLLHHFGPGQRTLQFLNVPYPDVQYATAHPCPAHPRNATLGKTSLQDLLNLASYDLFAMNGIVPFVKAAPTCQ